jgi:outer membrane protein TolC
MKLKMLSLSLCILMVLKPFAQGILEQYVQVAFTSNEGVKQQQFAFEKSIYSLKEAKALFLPNVGFRTDYFLAAGGRTVDFPAGDLLNPVYRTLNQLTGSNNFPQLQNQSILLNPNNFYDAKFRTTYPILNLEIGINKKIKQEQVQLQQAEINLYKRELAKEVKEAYFKYLQAAAAIKIYESAALLVKENQRINQSLYNNDKVNEAVLIRAKNEVIKLEALQEIATQTATSAKAFFNFLLNRPGADSIVIDTAYQLPLPIVGTEASIANREELLKLGIATHINKHLEGLSKTYLWPKLSTFLDLGLQGFNGKINNQAPYYFLGVTLQWDVFSGGKNIYKTHQAQLDNKIIKSQTSYVYTQLQLQYTTAINSFQSSLAAYRSAISTRQSSERYYTDMLRLYKEGQALFIELLDAQNQFIQAKLQSSITLYDTYIKAAEIERATASLTINN